MTSGRSDLMDILCERRAETDRAVLIYDGTEPVWLPKSQVEIDDAPRDDGLISVTLPEWLAREKGLI